MAPPLEPKPVGGAKTHSQNQGRARRHGVPVRPCHPPQTAGVTSAAAWLGRAARRVGRPRRRRAGRSVSEGGQCREVAVCPHTVHTRDSKHPHPTGGPHLTHSPATWSAFLPHVRSSTRTRSS
ncbi:DUF397 domain-containing protein [Streptomyces sp. NPDC002838]|uniref:DUF397 domain-containing protein n=1 Tax=Streptomyces sp. NPDC002838 TaxID=3154436 RepID=UPI00332E8AF7